ncbi:MAG: hypothetical protein KDC38_09840, partial [Planctomycetes bacterium]|nr:hypothetical protein [Planctomycetota bacterium]
LEWGSELYTIRREADGTLGIFDASDTLQWTCGRSIQSVTFETVVEDSLLHYQEIRVTIVASRNASDGTPISYTASGSVHMRN